MVLSGLSCFHNRWNRCTALININTQFHGNWAKSVCCKWAFSWLLWLTADFAHTPVHCQNPVSCLFRQRVLKLASVQKYSVKVVLLPSIWRGPKVFCGAGLAFMHFTRQRHSFRWNNYPHILEAVVTVAVRLSQAARVSEVFGNLFGRTQYNTWHSLPQDVSVHYRSLENESDSVHLSPCVIKQHLSWCTYVYMTSTFPRKSLCGQIFHELMLSYGQASQRLGADAVLALNSPNVPRSQQVASNMQQHVFTIKTEEGQEASA